MIDNALRTDRINKGGPRRPGGVAARSAPQRGGKALRLSHASPCTLTRRLHVHASMEHMPVAISSSNSLSRIAERVYQRALALPRRHSRLQPPPPALESRKQRCTSRPPRREHLSGTPAALAAQVCRPVRQGSFQKIGGLGGERDAEANAERAALVRVLTPTSERCRDRASIVFYLVKQRIQGKQVCEDSTRSFWLK